MMRAIVLVGALVGCVLWAGRGERDVAVACTGGFGGSLEALAEYESISLVEAMSVGDDVNRAPTLTPTSTPEATPTRSPFEVRTPISPPFATPEGPFAPPTASVPYDVRGYGATLRVLESYVGSRAGTFEIDTKIRAGVERAAREWDNGFLSTCTPGQFSYRYETGGTYLLFAGDQFEDLGFITLSRFRVEGDELVTRDADVYGLWMERTTYDAYFAGVPFLSFEGSTTVELAVDRVPLAKVLRAIAGLRGDVAIVPPDAGNAGLKR